ncbi:hypothetical protein [Brevundimonas sp.]|uniref:hypothetical protein n=1 Tax=Brevundimonas sp. TaxID=1871086 RepID=UPI0019AB68AE|nr:hypothetical protein [Brevundimonas sp.]MBD3835369.1 hypothetical protein [Brevundimonas sp.]
MTPDRPSLETLMNDPAVSYPLKAVLLVWWSRDPLDAANDAAALASVMGDRATALLEQHHGP